MTREEQIEAATAAYINGRLRNHVPPEEIEEIRLAYQAGFIYADEHPNLYSVTRKAVERGREYLIEKACEKLRASTILAETTIERFKKAMEEQE